MIFLHNFMDFLTPAIGEQLGEGSLAWLWQILYFGGPIQLGENGPTLVVLYSIVPWIGVMAEGYAWPLWLLYAVFIVVVALLYPACRWYWQRKTTRPATWMRYI